MNNDLNNNNEFSNVEQNDYYNNDSYYTNNNYDNNYSDTTYEEREKKSGVWWKILLVILIILIIIFLLLRFCGNGGKKSQDELYAELSAKVCAAAETYVLNNPTVLDKTQPGKSAIIKFQTLADANLIEAQIKNPYYDGSLFKTATVDKYYPMTNSVRLTVAADGTFNCELVDNSKDVTAPELRLNGDIEITLPIGTDFEDPGYSATDDYDGDITDKVVRSGNVDMTKAGKYELTYTVQDSAGNVTTKKRTIVYEEYADIEISMGSILDGVTPQISLKGSNPYCMVKGTKYVEPGAVATDNIDGNITDRIAVTNKVTGNLMGSFRVVYKVEDSSGNEAIAYRAVIVTTSCPTEEKPEKVVNNRPTITLIGKNSVTINRGTEYIDLGATAYDKEDGDITSRIVTDASNVNVNSAGVYKVIYRVTDSAGVTVSATRTVTVKDAVSGNPSVRFTEDKKNVEVVVGEGSNSLITAPKAVNENGVAVKVTTKIEDYTTKQVVNEIDWNKTGKYRVIYTAIHGNGTIKQTKSIVVTITSASVTIGGKDAINVILRNNNCDINEADLVKGGVTFTTKGKSTPIVTLTGNEGKACSVGTYEIIVEAKVDNGPTAKKSITVYVVNGTPQPVPVGQPGKVVITSNSANSTNVYNTNGQWVGGAVTGITLKFKSTPVEGTEISYFEYSEDCKNPNEKKLSTLVMTTCIGPSYAGTSGSDSTNCTTKATNEGQMTWTEEGSANVCIRAVTKTGVAGPWSDPVKLNIDRKGPSVYFTHSWPDEKENWHNKSSMTLEYNAKDSESGLSHFEYTYDDVKAKKADQITTYDEATGKLTVSENTEPTRSELFVYVRAVDKAGNKGEWTSNPAYVNLDTVKPNTPTLTVSGNNTQLVKINAKFEDGKSVRPSGFGKLVYTMNDGEEKDEFTQTITIPTNTAKENVAHFVKVWAVDKAGNRSDNYASENVIVAPGKTATGVQLKVDGKNVTNGGACSSTLAPGKTITMTATPIPTDAIEKEVTWLINDATVATIDENGKVSAKQTGITLVTAKIGSVSASCTLTVKSEVTGSSTPSDSGGSGDGGGSGPASSNDDEDKKWTVTSNGKTYEFDTKEQAERAAESTLNVNLTDNSNHPGSGVQPGDYMVVKDPAGNVVSKTTTTAGRSNYGGQTTTAIVTTTQKSDGSTVTTAQTSSGTKVTTAKTSGGQTTSVSTAYNVPVQVTTGGRVYIPDDWM